MAKKFVRTTKTVWDNKQDKSQYNDSVVFIEDSKQIWSNGIYYNSNSDIEIPSALPNPVPLTVTVNDPVVGQNTWVYDGNNDPNIFIDLTNASSGGNGNYEITEMTSLVDGLTFTRTDMGWALDSGYIGDTAYIPTTLEIDNWNNKQDLLVSGTNLKTINNQSLLGSGNIEISAGGSSTDTKNTVGSTYDQLGSPLFLVGVHGDEAHNQSYVQSYITGTGVNGTAQRRCWIEGNEANTVFNVPIINCDTVQCSNGIAATKFSTTSAIGSSTVPVYINSSGVPTPCSLPTTVSCTNTTSNSTYYIPFVNGYTTASRSMCTDSGITYNPSTNVLTATTFSGSLKGNADTATVADVNPIINMQHFDLEGAISNGSSGVNLYIRDSQSGAAATTGYPDNNWSYGGHGPIQHNIYIDLGDLNGGNSIVPQVQFVISNFDRGLDVWHNITYKATAGVGDKYAWFYINCPNQDYKVFYKIKRIDNTTTPDIVNQANDTSLSLETGQSHGIKLLTGLAKSINTSYPQIKRIPLPLKFNGNTSTYQEGFAVNTQCFQVKISRNYCENGTCVTNRITVEVVQVI